MVKLIHLKAPVIRPVARMVRAPQALAAPLHIVTCSSKALLQAGPTVRIVTTVLPHHIQPALTTKFLMVMTWGSVTTGMIPLSSATGAATALSVHSPESPIVIPPLARTIASNPVPVTRYALQGTAIMAASALPHQHVPPEVASIQVLAHVKLPLLYVVHPSSTMLLSTGV